MKFLYSFIAVILLLAAGNAYPQTSMDRRTKFMFDELRANALERKKAQEGQLSGSSTGEQPGVYLQETSPTALPDQSVPAADTTTTITDSSARIIAEPSRNTATPSTIQSSGAELPQRQYIQNTSGLGFFPDSSASSTPSGRNQPQPDAIPVAGYSSGIGGLNDDSDVGQATAEALRQEIGYEGFSGTRTNLNDGSVSAVIPASTPSVQNPEPEPASVWAPEVERIVSEQSQEPAIGVSQPDIVQDYNSASEDRYAFDESEFTEENFEELLKSTAEPRRQILSSDYEGPTSDYRIQPGDIISVEVFKEPDLSRELKVASSGEITFPLLSQVQVAGKSAAQAERYIRDLLTGDYLVNPHVIITVKEFKSEQISVQGYVNVPKLIPLPPDQPMTILQAISEAGGIQRIGNPNKIELIRQGQPNRSFRLKDLMEVSDPGQIVYLKPNDVIYVYERGLF